MTYLPDDSKYKEAWDGRDGLPDGVYIGDVQKVDFKATDAGDDVFTFQGVITEGPHKGTTFFSSIKTFSKEKNAAIKMNLAKVADISKLLGASEEILKNPSTGIKYALENLKGKSATISVAASDWQGKKFSNYTIADIIGPASQAYTDPDAVPTVTANPDDIPF